MTLNHTECDKYGGACFWNSTETCIYTFTITFETNGGSKCYSITKGYNEKAVLPIPTKTGYTFDGWYKESTFSTKWTEDKTMPAYNFILYAKWTVNIYSITFNSNGGSSVNQITQEYNTTIALPNSTKTGYRFECWTRDYNECTDVITMPAYNFILYAKWTVNSYTITFDSNGGSSVNQITQEYNTTITIPVNSTRIGYTFECWTKDGNECINAITMPAENITLIAKWNKDMISSSSSSQSAAKEVEYRLTITFDKKNISKAEVEKEIITILNDYTSNEIVIEENEDGDIVVIIVFDEEKDAEAFTRDVDTSTQFRNTIKGKDIEKVSKSDKGSGSIASICVLFIILSSLILI